MSDLNPKQATFAHIISIHHQLAILDKSLTDPAHIATASGIRVMLLELERLVRRL